MRMPRLTFVSEGHPLRRLLIVSKKTAVRRNRFCARDTSFHNEKNKAECPRQESNLILDHRKVACESGTLRGHVVSAPRQGVERASCGSEDHRASIALARHEILCVELLLFDAGPNRQLGRARMSTTF